MEKRFRFEACFNSRCQMKISHAYTRTVILKIRPKTRTLASHRKATLVKSVALHDDQLFHFVLISSKPNFCYGASISSVEVPSCTCKNGVFEIISVRVVADAHLGIIFGWNFKLFVTSSKINLKQHLGLSRRSKSCGHLIALNCRYFFVN